MAGKWAVFCDRALGESEKQNSNANFILIPGNIDITVCTWCTRLTIYSFTVSLVRQAAIHDIYLIYCTTPIDSPVDIWWYHINSVYLVIANTCTWYIIHKNVMQDTFVSIVVHYLYFHFARRVKCKYWGSSSELLLNQFLQTSYILKSHLNVSIREHSVIDWYFVPQRRERTQMAEFILYITLLGQHSGRTQEHKG